MSSSMKTVPGVLSLWVAWCTHPTTAEWTRCYCKSEVSCSMTHKVVCIREKRTQLRVVWIGEHLMSLHSIPLCTLGQVEYGVPSCISYRRAADPPYTCVLDRNGCTLTDAQIIAHSSAHLLWCTLLLFVEDTIDALIVRATLRGMFIGGSIVTEVID